MKEEEETEKNVLSVHVYIDNCYSPLKRLSNNMGEPVGIYAQWNKQSISNTHTHTQFH